MKVRFIFKGVKIIMQWNKLLTLGAMSGILCLFSACGGGAGGAGVISDTLAPKVTSVNVSSPKTGQLTLSANATDNTAVIAFCFKTSPVTPMATDACFEVSSSTTITLPHTSAVYVWAKDAAGNISASAPVGCSAAGISASLASALPTVCVSTSLGEFVLELESTKAPITTANFIKYVSDGFYSQTVFHRVIANFMVQGGGFTGVPIGASTAKIGTVYPAISLETTATTGVSNTIGTIAMARTSAPNSATSQFFINVVDNTALDNIGGGYAAFGRVISGMDTTLQSIRNVTVQSNGNEVSQPIMPPVVNWAYLLK
jgi:cyclophilin family peptidyl-prolyl cis-trans isomerase